MAKPSFQNASEAFVYDVCRESFLSLWSYANPRGDSGRELCDVLVVCEPDVIVLSVKDSELDLKTAPDVAVQRWFKKAVKKSVAQLYGAVRWLARSDRVIRADGSEGLPLPALETRRVHRVAVSLGGSRAVPLPSGDFGKGFVHVLDEKAFFLLLKTLDTVTDFASYLTAKEDLADRCPGLVVEGEENLLAMYLHRGRRFPEGCPDGPIPDGLWEQLLAKREYQRKLEEDRVSYIWDRLLEYFGKHALAGTFEFGNELTENELAFRIMARESRLGRRVLGASFEEFLRRAKAKELRSRMCPSIDGVGYVFLNAPPDASRDLRRQELELRSFVARGKLGCSKIVGICVNVEPAPEGYCEDILLLHIPEWTDEHERQSQGIQSDLGYFSAPVVTNQRVDEYPTD